MGHRVLAILLMAQVKKKKGPFASWVNTDTGLELQRS